MRRQSIPFIRMVWIGAWLFIVCFGIGFSGFAEESDLQFDDIIKMLDHSGKRFSYLGTKFVVDYTPSRRSTTLVKVTYGSPGWQKKEVSPLQQGESQIILDDGKFLWHYIPSQASVVKRKRRLSLGEISKRIHFQNELIQKNYYIRIETRPEILSAPESSKVPSVTGDVMVSFEPKAQDRPSWKMWIEREHGLVVRTEVYNINGDLALLSAFSELTFKSEIPKKAFVMTVPKGTKMRTSLEKHFQTIQEAQKYISFPISEPEYLPPGFMLATVIHSKTKQREKVQLAYIDGMSSISVFEEKRALPSTETSETSKKIDINDAVKGTFHDQGLLKVLRWTLSQNRHVTLVGEVSDSELLKIASSITE